MERKSVKISSNQNFEEDEELEPIIEFDFNNGCFNPNTIHPSLKEVFKKIGISKKDLKDKKMIPLIFESLVTAYSQLQEEIDKNKKSKSFTLKKQKNDEEFNKEENIENNQCFVKFDLKRGIFNIQHIHPTLKNIFKNAGITKKDLLNKEMAVSIIKAIVRSFCELHGVEESQELISKPLEN